MGGVNPYIDQDEIAVATRPFKVRVTGAGFSHSVGPGAGFSHSVGPGAVPSEREIAVDPSQLPFGRDGRPGSLLDILLNNGVQVDHACGGVCSCSTCHVIVRQGLASCNPSDEPEEDMLDSAPGLTPQSRLACQCVPNGSQDIVVEIPVWNRNQVKEGV